MGVDLAIGENASGAIWGTLAICGLFWLALHVILYRVLRGQARPLVKLFVKRTALLLSMMILFTTAFSIEWLPFLPRSADDVGAGLGGIGVIAVNCLIFLLVAWLGVLLVGRLAHASATQRGDGR